MAVAASTVGINALIANPNVIDEILKYIRIRKKHTNLEGSLFKPARKYTIIANINDGIILVGNSTINFATKYDTASYALDARSL